MIDILVLFYVDGDSQDVVNRHHIQRPAEKIGRELALQIGAKIDLRDRGHFVDYC